MAANPSTSSNANAGAPGSPGPTVASNTREVNVNIERLADKVYRLMLADLALQIRRSKGERR